MPRVRIDSVSEIKDAQRFIEKLEVKAMKAESSDVAFAPNEFYERLLVLRETKPKAFARLSSATLAALRAYELAKHDAKALRSARSR